MSQQMEHHEVEAPKGLWEGIEQRMEARKRGRRAKLVWAWRAGAAAAVVAGVVVGVQVWNAPEKGDGVQLAQTEEPKPLPSTLGQEENASAEQSASTARQSVVLAHNGVAHPGEKVVALHEEVAPSHKGVASPHQAVGSVVQSVAPQQALVAASSTPETSMPVSVTDVPAAESPVAQTPTPAAPKNDAPLLAENHAEEAEDVYIVTVPREKEGGESALSTNPTQHADGRTKHRVSLQLMAMATGEFSKSYDAAFVGDVNHSSKNPADTVRMESQRRAKPAGPARSHRQMNSAPLYGEHDFPVKVGVTLRMPLSRRLALDAGLSYARMRSELAFYAPVGHYETHGAQQVNYLGVPVALTADLWRNRWWSVYASAGGEVAKSVKTTWRTAEGRTFGVAERPWQWSVSAAVGVQFNITQHVGLYAQPSADYFFDNHSAVKTYYSDHPFTPALRMGVRVQL